MKTDDFSTGLWKLKIFGTVQCREALMGLDCAEREGTGFQRVERVSRVSGKSIDVWSL